ncbi:MAG TPA: ABC transporter permease [Acidimicrobiales bacterium]|nr:ABC transporter permease [Acidimicrobiales bacterium]
MAERPAGGGTGAPVRGRGARSGASVAAGRRLRRSRLPVAGGETHPLGDEHGMAGDARRQWQIVLGRFVRQPRAMISLGVFAVLGIGSVVAGFAWHYNYLTLTDQIATFTSGGPTWQHPFGVDPIGHDVFAQVMQGTKEDIQVALLVAAVTTLIGTTIGALAGYFRGWVDPILMRFTDFILAVPLLAVLAVLANLASKQSGSWFWVAMIIGFLAWTYVARLVRADFLSLRERDFVEAARAIGASNRRIIVRHLLPNAIGPIIVNATLTVANAIILESTLSFLGLGIQPPNISLGTLVASGEGDATTFWWLFVFPAAFIIVLILCINFIGDGLREAFDPRRSRVRA